ncbi:MAG: protein arginine kinase [Planctomycetaceae bacterium]|nr:protein arginine kinase [Planctomycetaceae bacterium]
MDLRSLLSVTCGWLEGTGLESDVVVSSRIRLARNLAHFPFLSRANTNARSEIECLLRDGIDKALSVESAAAGTEKQTDATAPEHPPLAYRDLQYIDVEALSPLDRQFLMERQLISRELSEGHGPRGVMIADRQQTSIMINEEDHLRMQVLRSGFNLQACWEEMNRLDDAIEREVPYAFHEQFGYLTACPTNVGTGIRVSVMVHLPALVQTREIQKVFQAMQKMNLAVRGLYGEGSQAMGDFYQISNQITLGRSEPEIVEMICDVVPNVIEYERRVRQALLAENQQGLHDQVSRAYGILRNAQTISSEETLHLLSSLRMGVNLGLIDMPDLALANELLIFTQPAHLQKKLNRELNSAERNTARAGYLRERLADFTQE